MGVELNYKLIGKRIRENRLKRGYTQEYVAECAEISPQHCSSIESGNTKLSLPCLVRVCNVLGITPDSLLMDSVSCATPQLMKNVAEVYEDCSSDEIYLMLSISEKLKEGMRIKKMRSL